MTLYYLDIETTGLEPHEGEILTIQYQNLESPNAPLVILKAWEHPDGERGIVNEFVSKNAYWTNKWKFMPVGYNLAFEFNWLFNKSVRYGLLPPHANATNYFKPSIDVQQVVLFFNNLAFKGSSLQNFSPKSGTGSNVIRYIEERRYDAIERYIIDETKGFVQLFNSLKKEMPLLWANTVAPSIGINPNE